MCLVALATNCLPPRISADSAFLLHAPCLGVDMVDTAVVRRVCELSARVTVLCCKDSPEEVLFGCMFRRVDKAAWTLRDMWPTVPPPDDRVQFALA